MENKNIKVFTVNYGKNKGFYICVENMEKNNAVKVLQDNDIYLGILQREYNEGLYRYYGIKNGYIFTLGGYTSYTYNKCIFYKYIQQLKDNGFNIIDITKHKNNLKKYA